MRLLDKAVQLASRAHQGKVDRYGAPSLFHSYRVMERMQGETEAVIAILHDTVEDTDLTLETLRDEGFPGEIVHAVDSLSRRDGESYTEYMERVRENPLAVRVKIADLEDNMDLRRYPEISGEDVERLRRYHHYWRVLTGKE